ncbi:hypothetical protein SLE2022_007810 [Rubroshorea leprosula]
MAPAVAFPNVDSTTLTNFVINQGNGAELGLKALPEHYIQPVGERIDTTKIITNESIPIIDLSNWDDPKVADSICDAAEKWGFFQIVNHGVPFEVLDHVQDATHRFFGLPAEEKNKYSKDHSPSNSVRFGTSFSPQAEKALEWKDYLSLFYVSEEQAAALWPPACRDEVLEFMKGSETVIKRLVNLNYYPICPNPELTIGVGRHSDVSTLTILLQDEIGGLYVKGHDGDDSWIHVPPIKGSLVINVGDALQILSNDRYKSIEHRVVANASKNRISIPIFVNPRPSALIGPLPEVLANGEKPIYKQVLYSDYVKHFFRRAHDGKGTVEFAKIEA